jgi:hypothetical protein
MSDTNLFAGSGVGVFLSTNNGTNWTAVNTGLTRPIVHALAMSGTNLFAGTRGGVWRRPLSEMITSVREIAGNGLPERYTLEQNFPNPFNPVTTIEFSLSRSSFVTLKVLNLLGEEVASLVSENLTAAKYSTEWNAGDVARGVYYYRLVAGAYVQTKKMLLLR